MTAQEQWDERGGSKDQQSKKSLVQALLSRKPLVIWPADKSLGKHERKGGEKGEKGPITRDAITRRGKLTLSGEAIGANDEEEA